MVDPTLFWYIVHLTLELALSILLQLLPKEWEELLAPHDSLPELTLAFVHTSVSIPISNEEHNAVTGLRGFSKERKILKDKC